MVKVFLPDNIQDKRPYAFELIILGGEPAQIKMTLSSSDCEFWGYVECGRLPVHNLFRKVLVMFHFIFPGAKVAIFVVEVIELWNLLSRMRWPGRRKHPDIH